MTEKFNVHKIDIDAQTVSSVEKYRSSFSCAYSYGQQQEVSTVDGMVMTVRKKKNSEMQRYKDPYCYRTRHFLAC